MDVYCWKSVLDPPYCHRHEFPGVELRWMSAGTRGSSSEWYVTTHGFQTYITPLVGKHWVIMTQLKDSHSDIHPFQSNIQKFRFARAVLVHPGQTLSVTLPYTCSRPLNLSPQQSHRTRCRLQGFVFGSRNNSWRLLL